MYSLLLDHNSLNLSKRGYASGLDFSTDELIGCFNFMYFVITISINSLTSDVSIVSYLLQQLAMKSM